MAQIIQNEDSDSYRAQEIQHYMSRVIDSQDEDEEEVDLFVDPEPEEHHEIDEIIEVRFNPDE